MAEMVIDIPINKLASMINNMNNQELDMLYMYMTKEGSELINRNKDLEQDRVKYLSEEEVFNV